MRVNQSLTYSGYRIMKATMLAVFIGLVLGNFGYQLINAHKWMVAWDRTFFQGLALVAVLIATRLMEA